MVAFLKDDHPGACWRCERILRARGNLSRIESRPTGDGIGRYFFDFDCGGAHHDARVGDALSGLPPHLR